MSIEITKLVDNALFGRKDIKFVIRHDGETTPSRKQIRELVASEVGAKANLVVVDHMESASGMAATRGVARAYSDLAQAQKLERKHFLLRNNINLPGKKAESEDKEDGGDS